MTTTTFSALEEAAKEAVGNWSRKDSFMWWERPEHAEKWMHYTLYHRDSGLLDQSNGEYIAKALAKYPRQVIRQSHSHFAVGWLEVLVIKVYTSRGKITAAFRKLYELQQRMSEDYFILDESDYSRRQYEATLENIAFAAHIYPQKYVLPSDWTNKVYSWFHDHDIELGNDDDCGGYPSQEQLDAAFEALGYFRNPKPKATP